MPSEAWEDQSFAWVLQTRPGTTGWRDALLTEEAETRSLSRLFRELPEGRPLTLDEILATFGSRAHGCALLLFSLPEALPLPIPSVSGILGVPLVAVSAHLALFGEASALPQAVSQRRLPARLLDVLRRCVAPIVQRAERVSHPRWGKFADHGRLLGLICLYLSLLLLLPLPFFNAPLALCLVFLAWGMVQRDGAFILAGLAGTVGVTVALARLADWLSALLGQ